MSLQQKFTELLLNIGFSEAETKTNWILVEKAYSKKSRQYHNLNHLMEMMACFDTYVSAYQFPNELLYAIFYHDYVYNSTRKDNELKSAEFALSILPQNAAIDKKKVFDMICATKDHQNNGIEEEKWLIDFDLKILAKDWEDYKVYFEQIRKEYRIYPDFLYKPGRAKALQHFLENDFIFQTEEFRALYEAKARKNIQTEIEYLTQ
ncbi:HD domain-containing protein [Flavobacterium sp.]|uniref:HD domain-containing protein n=1 Tax=Flavobacterium sp. TaxID=239 RepID=UPI003D6B5136